MGADLLGEGTADEETDGVMQPEPDSPPTPDTKIEKEMQIKKKKDLEKQKLQEAKTLEKERKLKEKQAKELEAKQKKQEEQLDKQLKQEQLKLEKDRKAQEKKLKDEQVKEKKLQEKLKKQQEKEAKEEEKRKQKESLKAVPSPENDKSAPTEVNQEVTDVEDLTTAAPEEVPESDMPDEGETKPSGVSVIKRGVPKNTKPAPAVVAIKMSDLFGEGLLMKKLMESCNQNLTVRLLQTQR